MKVTPSVPLQVSPVDGRSRLPTPSPEAPPHRVHFSVRPQNAAAAATTSGAASDSSDSEYSSNTTASGISQELQNYNLRSHRGQTRAEEQQCHHHHHHHQMSRGRAARTEEERGSGLGHRRSARQPAPPAYPVSSVGKLCRVCKSVGVDSLELNLTPRCRTQQSVHSHGCDSGPQQNSSRDPKSHLHRQAPPPAHPRMDAFETATEAGGHHGSHGPREHSAGHRARSSHNPPPSHHLPHHHPNPTPYCQPITTVTASASVTVAVHPSHLPNQNPPASSYPEYNATDSYCSSEPVFQDPHVPLDTHTGARGVKVEAMELQDLEFEAAENNNSSSRRGS